MRKQLYWLSDEEWRRIEPLLPRGRRGAHRVDDRRVISGIVHMLRSGARWRDCPPEYGPYTTIYNRFNRWSRQGIWLDMFKALIGGTNLFGSVSIDSSHVKAHRSAGGGKGGPSKKPSGVRAVAARPRSMRTDAIGRPWALRIAPGNMHDVMMAPELLSAAGSIKRLIADKAYDTNRLRNLLTQLDIEAVIPSIARRKPLIPYDREAYRQRNLIERMFARLNDFRRVATRYDKLARNFLAGVLIAASVIWWLN